MLGHGGGQRLGTGREEYARAPDGTDISDYLPEGWAFPAVLLLVVGVALGCGALALASLGAVPPLFLAIKYNHFSKAADTNEIYRPGRHFIGPFNKFLLFPSNVQTIEFMMDPMLPSAGIRYEPLHTRTKEGLGLHLQVSLQYRLIPDKLGDLYNEFNQNYEPVFTSSVRDVLIKAASEYEATQLWEEREAFGNIMQRMVDRELRKTYAECWGLQLMVIDLPDTFEQSIVSTQVQGQRMFMREQEQLSTKIRAETLVIEAQFDRQVKVMLAEGQANYTLLTKQAAAHAAQRKIDVEAEVLGELKERLELGPDGLVRYQKYSSLDDLQEASVLYGFGGSAQMLISSNGPAGV